MNESVHFLNGKLVKENDLRISPRDLGFARGYAIFEFIITYPTHRPFMLSSHINRLYKSAELIGLSMPWSKSQIGEWVMQTLNANSGGEKAIKIMISGGVAEALFPSGDPTIMIIVDPRHLCPEEWYEKGIGVIMVKHRRYSPEAKTNNYIEGVKQTQLAKKINAVEPVYYDDAQVFEAASSNIFATIDGKLLTPESNILDGVTREVLLNILKLGIPVEVKNFSLKELLSTKEAFLTGTNKEILPVTHIDGKPLGNGKVGEITKEVMRKFKEYTLHDLT